MVGQSIGHYRILEKLGAGGMGEVYRAEDTTLKRQIAVKVLRPEHAESRRRLERFQREAEALAALNHPNIVTVYSVEEVEGWPLLTMELIRGSTLADLIPEDGMRLSQFFDLAIPLAEALSAAHERGIVHRDLKPRNIMVADQGSLKVLDFGLAKLRPELDQPVDTEATTEVLTSEGRIMGTIPYMAPEQVAGAPVDQRSDIFSLGIILYQMATGHRPFHGASSAELASSILRDDPDPVDQLKREMPHHLARIIRQCLEKDPDQRLESAKDVAIQLRDLQREVTNDGWTAPPAIPDRPQMSVSRGVWLGGLLALVVAVASFAVWQWPDDPNPVWPLSPEARKLLNQGEAYEQRGDRREDLAEAEDRYRRALQLEPENPLIQAQLSALLARVQRQYPERERAEEATRLAEEALATEPKMAVAHVALGILALLEGDAESATASAERAIEAAPEAFRGYSLRGRSLIARGRVDEGLISLRKAVDLAGANQLARSALASELTSLGRLSDAAATYEEILQYDPDLPSALVNLGSIYMRTGRQLDAIPLLSRAVALGDDEVAASNLGTVYYDLGRFDLALEMFRKAYDIDPTKPIASYNIADTYLELGESALAREWYGTSLESFDRVIEAGGPKARMLALRALCAARLGRREEALAGVEEALALDPSSTYRLFNAAQVAALVGEVERLIDYTSRALEAGYPRQHFLDDAAFAAYRNDRDFLRLVVDTKDAA